MREFAGLKASRILDAQTRLEADLGITGDDGAELLQAAATRFGVVLADAQRGYRDTFQLEENDYLFHSEGLQLSGAEALASWIRRKPRPRVVGLTVGGLHEAILRATPSTPS